MTFLACTLTDAGGVVTVGTETSWSIIHVDGGYVRVDYENGGVGGEHGFGAVQPDPWSFRKPVRGGFDSTSFILFFADPGGSVAYNHVLFGVESTLTLRGVVVWGPDTLTADQVQPCT